MHSGKRESERVLVQMSVRLMSNVDAGYSAHVSEVVSADVGLVIVVSVTTGTGVSDGTWVRAGVNEGVSLSANVSVFV